jgi:triosephosphate isomerase (TIM)
MKKLFIIANWKSNKTTEEANDWLQKLANGGLEQNENKVAVVCAPFTLLPLLKSYSDEVILPVAFGSEDVSPFDEGAYTGEVSADEVKEFADYAIIGHSERRNLFKEDDELLTKKVQMALKAGLTPIFCIQDENTFIPEGVTLVAYEPVAAIGSGHPDTPENAERVIKSVKEKNPKVQYVLYGGSVTPENIHTFTQSPSIDGALIGGASLDAQKYIQLIQNA